MLLGRRVHYFPEHHLIDLKHVANRNIIMSGQSHLLFKPDHVLLQIIFAIITSHLRDSLAKSKNVVVDIPY